MRKGILIAILGGLIILFVALLRSEFIQADHAPLSAAGVESVVESGVETGVFSCPLDSQDSQQSRTSEGSGSYFANPLPPPPQDDTNSLADDRISASEVARADQTECYEYVVNSGFEELGGWYGQPSSNVGYEDTSWYTGASSVFLNTDFYSNSALWQTIEIPENVDSATLSLYSALAFADINDLFYVAIYNESFTELIEWDYLTFGATGVWKNFAYTVSPDVLAGRTIQLTFQMVQDYDDLYSEMLFDDVSLVLCGDEAVEAPTATTTPTPTAAATTAAATATVTPTPTLLPTNTPTATPIPATPVSGSAIDLSIDRVQVGQVLMAERDPLSGQEIPLIAEKPTLARVYVNLTGAEQVENLNGRLFVRDANDVVHEVQSINGPITLVGDSTEAGPGSTLNFVLDVAWLRGEIQLWAELDPANIIAENNEGNNASAELTRTFQPGKKTRIAWVAANLANEPVDPSIAQTGDSDLRKFFPVGVNDVEYFFQPGFSETFAAPLSIQSYPEYFNQLNRFFDRMTQEGRWVGGTPPDRLYGWTAGQPTALCGVADATWGGFGGRGRVAIGYAAGCGAETFAHEIGHVFDNQGLRHSPNAERNIDPNCVSRPVGAEPRYPFYPNLPEGSIGVVGFDVTRSQLLYPDRHYDFMSYCAPEWVSPFNYIRMTSGFGPAAGTAAAIAADDQESTKLLVSGLVYTGTVRAELDPFYLIRSSAPADGSTGSDYCIELQDSTEKSLVERCFDLSFRDVETGRMSLVDGFSLVTPYPQNTVKVVLTHNGEELATRTVTPNQPFVRLTSPTSGASLSSDAVTVRWNSADPDDDSLFHSLSYSTDAGDSWIPLAADISENSFEVDLTSLPGSTEVQFRVGASDGVNTAYATSGSLEIGFVADTTITVSGKPPQAAIRTQKTQIEGGAGVVLEGTGYDLEDGLLPEENLSWWSNRDGLLGSGSWLRKTLSDGTHKLTLTVTDSDGNSATAEHQLTVGTPANGGGESDAIFLPLVTR